jgi:hypothetical protein
VASRESEVNMKWIVAQLVIALLDRFDPSYAVKKILYGDEDQEASSVLFHMEFYAKIKLIDQVVC